MRCYVQAGERSHVIVLLVVGVGQERARGTYIHMHIHFMIANKPHDLHFERRNARFANGLGFAGSAYFAVPRERVS